MKGYGQFCPVAKAAEILGERWTPLIVRELISGSQSFNSIRRGVPLMSPTLLSNRLKTLEHTGVIERKEAENGVTYDLTKAGRELEPIIIELGVWGQRWARSDMTKKDLDPSLLMWDMHRQIDTSYFPEDRTVLMYEFVDYTSKMRRWWLVIKDHNVDICLKDPGYEVDLQIKTDLKTFTQMWMGHVTFSKVVRERKIEISGNSKLKNTMPKWIGLNRLAHVKPGDSRRS